MSQTPGGMRQGGPSLGIAREQSATMADYDALADLFLGEGGPAIASIASMPAPARTLKLAGDDREPSGSAPQPPRPPARKVSLPSGFEALALGHLPVLASAWAMQYARSVATLRAVPVAVLRVGSGKVSLEVVGEQSTEGPGAFASLEAAVRATARITDLWMLRVDEPSETELSGIDGVQGITLLTGADEVAIVNSYRAIKGYMENGLIARAGEEDGPQVAVRLAVMGAPEERAKEAAERIRKAASTYLGCVIDSVICSPKIAPAATRTMYRDESSLSVRDVVAGVIQAWKAEPAASPVASTTVSSVVEPAPGPVEAIMVPEIKSVAGATPAAGAAPTVSPGMPGTADDAIGDLIEVPLSGGRSQAGQDQGLVPVIGPMDPMPSRRPQPVAEVGASHSRIGPRTETPNAALCHILLGLSPLNIRCPFAPGAELACASDGTLHILGQAGHAGDAQRVVESLIAAASWAEVHAEILRQIRPGLRAGAGKSVMHVLTERAKDVRPLIDSDIKLHAIVRGASGMSSVADLN